VEFQFQTVGEGDELMETLAFFPKGQSWLDFMTPVSADSPVGEGVVARIMQYEVREGREAGEAVIVPSAFIANRDSSFILLEVMSDEGGS